MDTDAPDAPTRGLPDGPLILVADAAAYLRVSVHTVGRWIKTGTIPQSEVVGGRRNRRIRRRALLELAGEEERG